MVLFYDLMKLMDISKKSPLSMCYIRQETMYWIYSFDDEASSSSVPSVSGSSIIFKFLFAT